MGRIFTKQIYACEDQKALESRFSIPVVYLMVCVYQLIAYDNTYGFFGIIIRFHICDSSYSLKLVVLQLARCRSHYMRI